VIFTSTTLTRLRLADRCKNWPGPSRLTSEYPSLKVLSRVLRERHEFPAVFLSLRMGYDLEVKVLLGRPRCLNSTGSFCWLKAPA
jgi:hypothetical protein